MEQMFTNLTNPPLVTIFHCDTQWNTWYTTLWPSLNKFLEAEAELKNGMQNIAWGSSTQRKLKMQVIDLEGFRQDKHNQKEERLTGCGTQRRWFSLEKMNTKVC